MLIRKILAHSAVVLSLMYTVFFLIDKVNTAMGFINNNISKTLLFVLAIVSILNAVFIMADIRRKERNDAKREH